MTTEPKILVQCEVCGKAPLDGHTVYRTGQKGPGHNPHWRCEAHLGDAPVPDDVKHLTAVIEACRSTKH